MGSRTTVVYTLESLTVVLTRHGRVSMIHAARSERSQDLQLVKDRPSRNGLEVQQE